MWLTVQSISYSDLKRIHWVHSPGKRVTHLKVPSSTPKSVSHSLQPTPKVTDPPIPRRRQAAAISATFVRMNAILTTKPFPHSIATLRQEFMWKVQSTQLREQISHQRLSVFPSPSSRQCLNTSTHHTHSHSHTSHMTKMYFSQILFRKIVENKVYNSI